MQADDYADKNFYVRLRVGGNEVRTVVLLWVVGRLMQGNLVSKEASGGHVSMSCLFPTVCML